MLSSSSSPRMEISRHNFSFAVKESRKGKNAAGNEEKKRRQNSVCFLSRSVYVKFLLRGKS
jgi:hypothetical protein